MKRLIELGFLACVAAAAAAHPAAKQKLSVIERADRLSTGQFVWEPDAALTGPVVLVIDLTRQHVLVYRGGAMAKLGHNHVIASHDLAGSVFVAGDPLATSFDIHFPVDKLTVDEPALRAVAGPDFPGSVPQNAREGTHTNLLSAALLDGGTYPEIRLRATGFKAAGEGYEAGIEVTLKGETHLLHVPVTVTRDGGALTARGEFPLKQSELGLAPFSVAMGTLVVLDDMRVRFTLVAR